MVWRNIISLWFVPYLIFYDINFEVLVPNSTLINPLSRDNTSSHWN